MRKTPPNEESATRGREEEVGAGGRHTEKRPAARGDAPSQHTKEPPELCPNKVTRSRSPPKL
jgi:hypothetical protein